MELFLWLFILGLWFPSRCVAASSNTVDRAMQSRAISWPVCGCQECVENWDADASGFTCGDRITYLLQVSNFGPSKACRTVAASEFPDTCRLCNPDTCTRLDRAEEEPQNEPAQKPQGNQNFRCGCDLCEKFAWDVNAGGYSCGDRIDFLLSVQNAYPTEEAACRQVAVNEFPQECGLCAPGPCDGSPPPPTPAPTPLKQTSFLPPKELYCFPPESQRTRYQNAFGKYTVEVKEGDSCGPSNNRFSSSQVSMSNNNNELTLQLRRESDGRWSAGEVRILLPSEEYYNYGKYSFSVKSILVFDSVTGRVVGESLPPSIILGLFTWDDTKNYAIREDYNQEVDIELSRWNIWDNEDVQFLVQPPGNPQMYRFYSGKPPTISLPVYDQAPHDYSFLWNPAEITWSSTAGGGQTFTYGAKEALAAGQPDYSQCMPAKVEVRINLWALNGSFEAPTDMKDSHVVQVVIDKFKYEPSGIQALPESGVCTKDCQCDGNSRCIGNQCTSTGSQKANVAAATNDVENDVSLAPFWRQYRWAVLGMLLSFVILLALMIFTYYRRQQSRSMYPTVKKERTDADEDLESSSTSEYDPHRMAAEGEANGSQTTPRNEFLRIISVDGAVELHDYPQQEGTTIT